MLTIRDNPVFLNEKVEMLTTISTPGVDDEKVESPDPEGVDM